MRFEILGPLSVRRDGTPVVPGGPRERKTLAALVLGEGYPRSRTQLADAIWDGRQPATVTAQLHNSVAALRRALGPEVRITRSPGGFALDLTGHELDLAEFSALVAAGETAADPVEAVARYRAALALWRGPALDGLTDGALATEAQRLEEEQRLPCLERCLALELELGRHWQVVGELATLAAAHPLRERLVELRMLALHRTGRRHEALAAYQELRGKLASELGVDPSPELQHLHAVVRRDLPPATPRDAAAAPDRLAAQLQALTARVAELERRLARCPSTCPAGAAGC